ncbi:MAG: ChaN family lipoprotein [Pseudohongiellaceae bacterium]
MERIKAAAFLAALLIAGCVAAPLDNSLQWQSQLYADHALVGMIWDSERSLFIDANELFGRLEGASYLLLGEKHDNPDHHELQLRVLEHVLGTEKVSNVSFEMMTSDQQPLLESVSSLQQSDLDTIEEYLQWDSDGWDWDFYGPLVQAAIAANVSIKAANISNEEMMRVYAEPTPDEIADVLDALTVTALEKDIDESHCGMLPESQFPAMVRVQQARDFAMAKSLTAGFSRQMQVLIAGNYHIRRDLGVPNYILHTQRGRRPDRIISLSFMEVDAGSVEPHDYLQQFGGTRAYDYIWFTPAVSDEDYCASMRQP